MGGGAASLHLNNTTHEGRRSQSITFSCVQMCNRISDGLFGGVKFNCTEVRVRDGTKMISLENECKPGHSRSLAVGILVCECLARVEDENARECLMSSEREWSMFILVEGAQFRHYIYSQRTNTQFSSWIGLTAGVDRLSWCWVPWAFKGPSCYIEC